MLRKHPTMLIAQAKKIVPRFSSKRSTIALAMALSDPNRGGDPFWCVGAKSNMIFQVDGTLQASLDIETYRVAPHEYLGSVNQEGLPLSRYEGWELFCFRSLINIGYIDRGDRGRIVCENVRLCGKGTIIGGGNPLGLAMRNPYADREQYPEYVSDGKPGRRVRGRLICMMQAKTSI